MEVKVLKKEEINKEAAKIFIDLVNETYAMNSMQERKNHKPLTNEIRDMLKDVQSQKEVR